MRKERTGNGAPSARSGGPSQYRWIWYSKNNQGLLDWSHVSERMEKALALLDLLSRLGRPSTHYAGRRIVARWAIVLWRQSRPGGIETS